MSDGTGDTGETEDNYFSYLMRMLRTQIGHTQVWRISLEEPRTQQVHRFQDLESLLAFLRARTGQEGEFDDNRDASTSRAFEIGTGIEGNE